MEWHNVWVLVTQHSQSGQILRVQEFGKQIASHRKLNSSDGKLDVAVCQQTFTRQCVLSVVKDLLVYTQYDKQI